LAAAAKDRTGVERTTRARWGAAARTERMAWRENMVVVIGKRRCWSWPEVRWLGKGEVVVMLCRLNRGAQ
jgi:hypothetical protein